MPSTPQTIASVQVFDYAMLPGDPALTQIPAVPAGTKVSVTLQYKLGRSTATGDWIAGRTVYATTTDGNGYWTVFVVPNNKIAPANTFYTVEVEGFFSYKIQVTDVGVPAGGWQSSAVGILLDVPTNLAPTTSTVGAITATGLITAQAGINITAGGLTVAGGETATGNLTVDTLFYSTAVSRLVPGATSFSVRDNANANDNLLVTNAGNTTVRGSLTITAGPLNVTAGGITVTAGGAAITGNSTVTGTLTVSQALTIQAGGITVTGNSAVTGTLTVSGLVTAQAGVLISAGTLQMSAAASQIVPGATSLALTNTANSANNLLLTDVGLATFRNGVLIPATAGGSLAPNSAYATMPIKIDDQLLGAAAASITFVNPLPTNFRHLLITYYARGDTAAASISITLRFNNIATATYDYDYVQIAGVATNVPIESLGATGIIVGFVPAASATAGYFGQGEIRVAHYQGTTGNKLITADNSWATGDTTGLQIQNRLMGKWRTTATAVTRVDLIPSAGNFAAGSLFTLWGIP